MQEFIDAFAVTFVVTFLLGSIPFGLIISKVFYKTDIRKHGSGNIGTTNAIRTMGKVGGYSVFILDFGKGVLSGFIGIWVGQLFLSLHGQGAMADQLMAALTPFNVFLGSHAASFEVHFAQVLVAISFLGCVWGHVFSPWLKFKGGKGIAVAVGCLFVTLGIPAAILELVVFAALVVLTRYVSVGSIAAGALCPFLSFYLLWGNWPAAIICSIAGLTVIWAHRGNIKRLMTGTESRIGDKKKVRTQ